MTRHGELYLVNPTLDAANPIKMMPETARRTSPCVENIEIKGRYLLGDKQEYDCAARRLSPDTAEIIAPISGAVGERVIVYLDQIGMLTGTIVAIVPHGFRMIIEVTPERRARIAARLDWLVAQVNEDTDQRSDQRIVPTRTAVQVHLPNGDVQPGTIVDLSMSGAAIRIAARPLLGEAVTVGKRRAMVVRHLEDGFAVTFLLPLRPETFGPHTVL